MKKTKAPPATAPEAVAPAVLPPSLARKIKVLKIAALRPSPGNARRHSREQLEQLAASIQRFGFNQPILIAPDLEIVAGHGRLEAAKLAGMLEVPTIDVGHLSPERRRAYAIADNRIAELATWDGDMLAHELAALEDLGELDAIGFSDEEIAKITGELEEPEKAAAKPKAAEEPAREKIYQTIAPVARAGELWTLGNHRVLCGDSRKAESIARVMGGKKVELLVSDPPYCAGGFQEANKQAGTWGTINSDNLSTRGYQALIRQALTAAEPKALYLFTDWRMWSTLNDVVEAVSQPVRSMIVWAKDSAGLGSLWRGQHELILFATKTKNPRLKGETAPGNVIRGARTGNVHHWTEKPVEVMAQILAGDKVSERKSCDVLDCFMGSGSTLLAAEREGRRFRGIDLEPMLVDVTIWRWQRLTGKKATLESGETYDELAKKRAK